MTRLTRRTTLTVLLSAAVVAGLTMTQPPTAARAQTGGTDYCQGQCMDILPPGENGNSTLADILLYQALGIRPSNFTDQLGPYSSLVDSYKGLTGATLGNFFNNASFGVPANQVASTQSPLSGVTIVRDTHDIPHIYGATRYDTEYGAGYAAAEDRLWVMDLFRHVARGELTSFAGGAVGNRQLEQSFWQAAPYTEAELQSQINAVAAQGARGQQALADSQAYIDGLNAYITQAYNNRTFPGEYDLTGHVNPITNAGSIQPFTLTDLVALASVIGALFGSGGGNQVQSALVKEAADARYGTTLGDQVWQSFREANDPEAVQTLHDGQSFPYGLDPANPQGAAMPDPGSVTAAQEVFDPTGSAASTVSKAAGVFPGNLLTAHQGMSNALVVSGKYTASGHPVAVFGPQTGYFAPQLLMLEELQGPGISARGAAFAGLSFYVELGRGQDYAWSATSAGQDITDTYAVQLCNTDGSPATTQSIAYLYNGVCTPMDKLEVDDSWSPNTADSTPAGSYKLIMYRTKYGIVDFRATIGGVPVAYTELRSTYLHEVDSIIGFQELNDPGFVNSPQTFQQAASNINYTFNWFYVDSQHTAYFNSGRNPVRPANVAPDLPVWGSPQYAWTGFEPFSAHPHSIDQNYYISWNNKQADNYASGGFGDGSVHRANLLDARVKALVQQAASGGPKVTQVSLVQAMESAAVTDLRAEDVLPELLAVINSSPVTDPTQAALVQQLSSWLAAGGTRVETSAGSQTYAYGSIIQTFDAWWPLLVQSEFSSGLGSSLYTALTNALQINESPSGGQMGGSSPGDINGSIPHKGSSFQFGWWSYVDKDLRAVLGKPVVGGLAQVYCGGGSLAACRSMLLSTLVQASQESASTVYPGDSSCAAGNQWCADSIIQRPLGGISDPITNWQNRPTYQQVIEFPAHR